MFPYWILFSVFALGAIQTSARKSADRGVTPLLLLAVLATTLMIGLRWETGGDWSNYEEIFEYMRYMNLGSALAVGRSDPGYSLFNWMAHELGVGIWLVNLGCGAILMWGLMRFAARQPEPWLVILLAVPYLIIVVGMGYTRQAAAIGFVLAALAAFSEKRLLRFLILMTFATMFHKSCVLVLPLVGLAITTNRILTVGLVAMIGIILYFSFLSSRIDVLTQNYLVAQLESEGAAVRVMMSVVPALIYLPLQSRFGFNDQERKLWRNMSLAAVLAGLSLLFLPSSTAVDRLALYLIPLQLVVLSRVPVALSTDRIRNPVLVMLLILYSASIQLVWLNYATHSIYWVPYEVYPFGFEEGTLYD